jgi:RNA polymerase sigma factor (sigma-70 family)
MGSANETLAQPRAGRVPATPSPVHDAYHRHGPALLRKAERILQNPDDAGDILHSLFLDLMSRSNANVELPYLYRAIGNRCINFLRDRGNRARLLEREQPALRGPVRTRCDEQVIGLDLLAKLAHALDEKSLEILICCYWDDMTQEEVAGFLGTSRKTVGKRLKKIRDAVIEIRAQGDEHD